MGFAPGNGYKFLGKPIIEKAGLRLVEGEVGQFLKVNVNGRFVPADAADLVSAGCGGLIHAARTFDPTKNTKWTTWAITCVRQAIYKAAPKVKDALGGAHEVVGLQSHLGDSDDRNDDRGWTDTVADGDQPMFFSDHDDNTLARRKAAAGRTDHDEQRFPVSVWRRLRQEMPKRREFSVLLMRQLYYAHEEIGRRFKVSAERIRQIEKAALATAERVILDDLTGSRHGTVSHGVIWRRHRDEIRTLPPESLRAFHNDPSAFDVLGARFLLEGQLERGMNVRSARDAKIGCRVKRATPIDLTWQDFLLLAATQAATELGVALNKRKVKTNGNTERSATRHHVAAPALAADQCGSGTGIMQPQRAHQTGDGSISADA